MSHPEHSSLVVHLCHCLICYYISVENLALQVPSIHDKLLFAETRFYWQLGAVNHNNPETQNITLVEFNHNHCPQNIFLNVFSSSIWLNRNQISIYVFNLEKNLKGKYGVCPTLSPFSLWRNGPSIWAPSSQSSAMRVKSEEDLAPRASVWMTRQKCGRNFPMHLT